MPDTPTPETLQQMMERWRKLAAERNPQSPYLSNQLAAYWLVWCADELAALLDAAPQVGTWQHMDTAPRDGTRVMLAWAHGIVLARWSDEAAFPRCHRDCGWEVAAVEDCWYAFSLKPDEPTHWMPLPAAPKEPQS